MSSRFTASVRRHRAVGAVVLVGAGLVGASNVGAALAPAAAPQGRIPFVDPFARPPQELVRAASDGEAAVVEAAVAEAAVAEAAVVEDPAVAPDQTADGTGDAGVATPVSRAVVPQPRTGDQWLASVAAATGIPPRALQAYGTATLALATQDPACHLGWPSLAAIGWIESGHGTHGGGALGADGRPSAPIVGPALDGRPGRAAIVSTPTTQAWHGDPAWDHAVGPMQFIPSTWARWGADGDGDGTADPQDVDDAALATARYLCAGGRDLGTWDGWHAAVLSYNHSEAYVGSVLTRAGDYAQRARTGGAG